MLLESFVQDVADELTNLGRAWCRNAGKKSKTYAGSNGPPVGWRKSWLVWYGEAKTCALNLISDEMMTRDLPGYLAYYGRRTSPEAHQVLSESGKAKRSAHEKWQEDLGQVRNGTRQPLHN